MKEGDPLTKCDLLQIRLWFWINCCRPINVHPANKFLCVHFFEAKRCICFQSKRKEKIALQDFKENKNSNCAFSINNSVLFTVSSLCTKIWSLLQIYPRMYVCTYVYWWHSYEELKKRFEKFRKCFLHIHAIASLIMETLLD